MKYKITKGKSVNTIKLKPHDYKLNGENIHADFFPFVKGKPRYDLNSCDHCMFDNGTGECEKAKKIKGQSDDKLYLFCGNICGYFELQKEDDG